MAKKSSAVPFVLIFRVVQQAGAQNFWQAFWTQDEDHEEMHNTPISTYVHCAACHNQGMLANVCAGYFDKNIRGVAFPDPRVICTFFYFFQF